MMDNARTHLLSVRELPTLGIQIVRQPPYSPYVQPVENVLSLIRRRVYEGNRQFYSLDALEARAQEVVNQLINSGADVHMYNNIIVSMPRRVSDLIASGGRPLRQAALYVHC
jgi:hypothetical protein